MKYGTCIRCISLILALVMCTGVLPVSIIASDLNFSNFAKINEYTEGVFYDVSKNDWFEENVKSVYEKGLMIGKGNNLFDPNGNVTLAETIAIASRIHSIYTTGNETFSQDEPWYQIYVDYAISNGIISGFDDDEVLIPVTRVVFADIFAKALPEEAFEEKNHVDDNAIPDVSLESSYSDSIYKLYRAGILVGNDAMGTFMPETKIRRSEVSAIVARMVDPSQREEIAISIQRGGEEDVSDNEEKTKINTIQNEKPYINWSEWNRRLLGISGKEHQHQYEDENNSDITIKINTDSGYIVTSEDKIRIEGTAISRYEIREICAECETYDGTEYYTCQVDGTNWVVTINLKIGTNRVSIIAVDEREYSEKAIITINRESDIIKLSENVKMTDEDTYEQLYSDIVAIWNDDKSTPDDPRDDQKVMLVTENSLLLNQIRESRLIDGNIYYIPQNEYFLTGFVGIYRSHRAPIGNADYPAYTFTDDLYEEIVFDYAGFSDLLDTDISIDFSKGIDPDNPIAFAYFPDGTDINFQKVDSISDLNQNSKRNLSRNNPYLYRSENIMDDEKDVDKKKEESKYSKAGWITDEIKEKAIPQLSISTGIKDVIYEDYIQDEWEKKEKTNELNISLEWKDIVIYDDDGVKNEGTVDDGQIKFSFNIFLKNVTFDGGLEYHPGLSLDGLDILPQQCKVKVKGEYGGGFTLTDNWVTITTEEVVKALNDGYENKIKLGDLTLSGVDTFNKKIVMGVIGVQIPTFVTLAGISITEQAELSIISPVIVIYIFLGLDGQISLEATFSAEYSKSFTQGFNLQKNGFVGSHGSQKANRSDDHQEVFDDYTLDIYHNVSDDLIEEADHAKSSMSLTGKAKAEFDGSAGFGVGLMFLGLCPLTTDLSAFAHVEGDINGTIHFLPVLGVSAEASIKGKAGLRFNLNVKAACKGKESLKWINVDNKFSLTKEWLALEGTIGEWSTTNPVGIYYPEPDAPNGDFLELRKDNTGVAQISPWDWYGTDPVPDFQYDLTWGLTPGELIGFPGELLSIKIFEKYGVWGEKGKTYTMYFRVDNDILYYLKSDFKYEYMASNGYYVKGKFNAEDLMGKVFVQKDVDYDLGKYTLPDGTAIYPCIFFDPNNYDSDVYFADIILVFPEDEVPEYMRDWFPTDGFWYNYDVTYKIDKDYIIINPSYEESFYEIDGHMIAKEIRFKILSENEIVFESFSPDYYYDSLTNYHKVYNVGATYPKDVFDLDLDS